MSWRLRHDWRAGVKLPTGPQLSTCLDCGTIRSVENGRAVYLRAVHLENERVREAEPPCLSQPPRRKAKSGAGRDRFGCELGAAARAEALREALERAPKD